MFNKDMKESKNLLVVFINHVVGGFGWVVGITIGFTIVGFITTRMVSTLGGLPFVGSLIADVITVTQTALTRNTK